MPQGAGHSNKKGALPTYLLRRHRRAPDTSRSGGRRRHALRSVAADAGYAVITAGGGYEADDFIGAVCASLQSADAESSTPDELVVIRPDLTQTQ